MGEFSKNKFLFGSNNQLYITNIYSFDFNKNNIKYVETTDEAYEIYLKNGGRIMTEDELHKFDFQKLKNRNFILYGTSD